MDDPEMERLQDQDEASCAVWEWLKCDSSKRNSETVREFSKVELEVVAGRLGVSPPRLVIILKAFEKLNWIKDGKLRGWPKYQQSRSAEEEAWRKKAEYWHERARLYGDKGELFSPTTLPKSPNTKREKVPELTDEQWFADLQSQECYKHMSVKSQYQKMVNWCKANDKVPSRKRFVNWLNKCDLPMKSTLNNKHNYEGVKAPDLFDGRA